MATTRAAKKVAKKPAAGGPLADLLRKGMVQKGSDPDLIVHWQSTGIPQLDEITNGGVPFNRWMELYGEYSAAKTLFAMLIARQFQMDGHTVALIDAELAYDAKWWGSVGIDTEELLVSQPTSGEQAVDVIQALCGKVQLIIIDSIAAMIPLAVQERDAEESAMGRHAQLISRLFQKGNPALKKSGTAIIAINQTRSNFAPGGYDVLPGGKAQGFYSSIMLRLRRQGFVESGGVKTGFVIQVYCSKNKLGTPYKQVELPFAFDGTFDFTTMLVSDALDRKIITQAGPWYRVPNALAPDSDGMKDVANADMMQIMGRAALNAAYEEDEAARQALEQAVYHGAAFAGVEDDEHDETAPAVGFAGG